MLYIIGTPIGNLEDISMRALRILGEVDFILAEDTRVSRKLLNHFEIKTSVVSFHEHSKEGAYEKIFELLSEGKDLALITDAGMPGVSDPGSRLVSRIRGEMPEVKIESIPGPSAVTSAISIAGIPMTEFYFAGFAPHKKGRQTFFKNIREKIKDGQAFIFFESPHRVIKAVESLKEFLPEINVVIAKELTKIHEEIITGNPEKVLRFLEENPDKVKGEFVVIVY